MRGEYTWSSLPDGSTAAHDDDGERSGERRCRRARASLHRQPRRRQASASAGDGSPVRVRRARRTQPASTTHWKTNADGYERLARCAAGSCRDGQQPRLRPVSSTTSRLIRINNVWDDTGDRQSRGDPRSTSSRPTPKVIERCLLMTTDPGDLVLDPTCGSRHDGLRRRAVGPALDHHRHQPRRPRAGPHAADGGEVSRTTCSPTRPKGVRKEAEVTGKLPPDVQDRRRHPARASSTSACRTSRSSPSPTTRTSRRA